MNFISFGSGSSGNCYYFYNERSGIMIDAGVSLRRLKRDFATYGLNLSRIDGLLLTHDHADHVKHVAKVSGQLGLNVYSTSAVHRALSALRFDSSHVEPRHVRFLEQGECIELGDFKVTAFRVPHDSMDCSGYFIECDDVAVCLITDVGSVTDEIAAYIRRCSHLIIEANYDKEMLENGKYPKMLKYRISCGTGHLSNVYCGEAIVEHASDELKAVFLCHLSAENNKPAIAERVVGEKIQTRFGDSVELHVLERTKISGPFLLIHNS